MSVVEPTDMSGPRPREHRLVAVVCLMMLVAAACSRAPLPGTTVAAGGSAPAGGAGTAGVPDTGGAPVAGGGPTPTSPGDTGPADGGQPGAGPAPATPPGSTPAPGPGTPAGPGDPPPPTAGPTTTPGDPGPRLWSGADDTRGISETEIVLCAHAALTYGAAFNTSADDLNVYWEEVNAAGGIHGRHIRVFYENDNYSPDTAVQAATACRDRYDPFMLIGGIGFDQIPTVREWAEANRMLYLHHTATVQGTEGKRYSFSALPTTELMGELFAELAAARFATEPIGIIKRGSVNWEPGVVGFKRVAERHGLNIVAERQVQVNKGTYLDDIVALRNAGAEVVWLWLNALESTEFILQARNQAWSPRFMVFPFNLTSQTLGDAALDPPLVGVAMFNAYSFGDRSGEFARYADDLDQFEDQYARHRPNVDLSGVGGDLLFLNWSAQKALGVVLDRCGPDCTRNRFVEVLEGLRGRLTSSACEVDFPRHPGRRLGGWRVSVMEAYRAPDGKVNFRNTHTCVEHLL